MRTCCCVANRCILKLYCAQEVFQQLQSYMYEVDHTLDELPEVNENSTQQQLETAAKAAYNYHVMKASREQDKVRVGATACLL